MLNHYQWKWKWDVSKAWMFCDFTELKLSLHVSSKVISNRIKDHRTTVDLLIVNYAMSVKHEDNSFRDAENALLIIDCHKYYY